jgi:hypothetical protein
VRTRQAEGAGAGSINGIDRLIRNVQTGRPELSLSALTAVKIFVDRQGTSARAPVAFGSVGVVAGVVEAGRRTAPRSRFRCR